MNAFALPAARRSPRLFQSAKTDFLADLEREFGTLEEGSGNVAEETAQAALMDLWTEHDHLFGDLASFFAVRTGSLRESSIVAAHSARKESGLATEKQNGEGQAMCQAGGAALQIPTAVALPVLSQPRIHGPPEEMLLSKKKKWASMEAWKAERSHALVSGQW